MTLNLPSGKDERYSSCIPG